MATLLFTFWRYEFTMAKKSRRARRQSKPAAAPAVTSPAPAPTTPPETANSQRKWVDFAVEYAYVYRDLRTIGLIAVLLLIVLFGLSFIIV